MDHHHNREQSEEEKRRAYLDSLTAESEVRAPNMGQRIKEEVQAVVHSIADKLCIPQKDKTRT